MAIVMRDHPAWLTTDGSALRVFGSGWAVAAGGDGWRTYGIGAGEPQVFGPDLLPASVPASLLRTLAGLGAVARWRNPDLWDAIATAIVRQVIRADQARRLYRQFCAAYGKPVATPKGVVHAMPEASVVAELPAEAFAAVGLAFKRRPLQAAAEAYLEDGSRWHELSGEQLIVELQTVPHIGPWTAGAAVADFTHDWALYPFGDLAVRKWARVAAPDLDWPAKEKDFAARWRELAADRLGPLTLFTLAWGGHHGGSR